MWWWFDNLWSQRLIAFSIEDALSLNNASEYAWLSDDFIHSHSENYSHSICFLSVDKHLILCIQFWCKLQECF